ncbi:MAG: glycoside hydrolase family 127 protein [Armatimonadetes bacterium]|nr:glycoside hydrolase family 127 protein [Planctomycetota bacterium]MBI2201831.1 glycoside hydrolase family 127 protein [Armatimonadota bacterium]
MQNPEKVTLNYINPAAPLVPPPSTPGESYDVLAPATLDLAERARLCVNALTETTDPAYDDELYWIVDLLAQKPGMYHTVDDHVQAKFLQALPLDRTACGSPQNLEVEHRLMQTYLKMQGPDGLIYIPIKGRPWALPAAANPWAIDPLPTGDHWCSLCPTGRTLGAFCVYALRYPAGPWADAARRLARGLMNLCIVEDDIAYLPGNCAEPGRPLPKPASRPVGLRAGYSGWVAQGLAQYARSLGDREAGAMATRLMRYVLRDSGYFGPGGEFTFEFPGVARAIHFHAHTCQILAALEAVQASGDAELLGLARKAYDYAVSEGTPLVGFFPEWLGNRGGGYGEGQFSSEICEVADMIASALKLSMLGMDQWDDVDRWVRNQFAECQLTDTTWLTDGHLERVDRKLSPLPGAGCSRPEYGTTDRVIERSVGSFSGWPSANDFVQGKGWSIMHCCTGNATRTVYYVWEKILTHERGKLKVNLLLNRASRWADVYSHIPYRGRVDVRAKQDMDLEIRLAEWVKPEEARCTVNGVPRPLSFAGRYAQVGPVKAGQEATLEFPIHERTDRVIIEKRPYTLIRRGNEVVWIDPPGTTCPLYQRGHYRYGETLWRTVRRFVPDAEVPWC